MGSGQFAELLFIERFDPLVQGDKGETDVLLDRYIAYRAATGRPVSRKEFVDAIRYTKAMRGYGPKVAKSIAARARRHKGVSK
jgi:hypothetical protein